MKKLKKIKACYMEQLPTELKLQIMGYLPGKDLARLACVSCEWRRLTPSSDSEVWKNFCQADKFWKIGREYFCNHPKYENNFGLTWKDLFGLWTLCGQYYNWVLLLQHGADHGLHWAIKMYRWVRDFPPYELLPDHDDILSPGFIDQAPELPYFGFNFKPLLPIQEKIYREHLLMVHEGSYQLYHPLPPPPIPPKCQRTRTQRQAITRKDLCISPMTPKDSGVDKAPSGSQKQE